EVARVVLDVDVVADLTAVRAGPLPVDVDAVEHAGRRTGAATAVDHGQVALDVDVDARPHELLARGLRRGGLGEVLGPGPAADRDQRPQVRVLRLELLELVERPGEGLVPRV